MNGGTRLSYYNYTIEVKFLHICDWLWEKGHIHASIDFSV